MSEPRDDSRCQSPSESLSNWRTYEHQLSPSDVIVSIPTDLDTTESVYEEVEYLEDTRTDLDTTESVTNITNGSLVVTTRKQPLHSQHIASPSTPPTEDPELSTIDDSVEDPDYVPFDEGNRIKTTTSPPPAEDPELSTIDDSVEDPDYGPFDEGNRIGTLSDIFMDADPDRTRTLSDVSMDLDQGSPSIFDINHLEFRTSTPQFEEISHNNGRLRQETNEQRVPLSQNNAAHNQVFENNTQEIDRPRNSHEELVEQENLHNQDHLDPEIQQDIPNHSKSEKRRSKQFEKRAEHINKLKLKHPINLTTCNNCSNKCSSKFSEADRHCIYDTYWNLDYTSRRKWLASSVKTVSVQRRRVHNSGDNFRKKESRRYVLIKNEKEERVCLNFLLKTLGYTSDSVITELRKASKRAPLFGKVTENRGRKKHKKICNYKLIEEHINSYHPCVAHYRRHNAPNARYLPIGLSLKDIYLDFKTKHPGVCSKETYRKVLCDLGVSLHKPESDICTDCALYNKEKVSYQEKGEDIPEEIERKYKEHTEKANEAKNEYKNDREKEEGTELKIYSMDLEKVILLPMMPKVKDSFFISRLIVFNETFASLKPGIQNYCCIWHEADAGRDAPQIVDSLVAFLKIERDTENFVFWPDNCVGQNKNWYLYTALVMIVNSNIAGPIKSLTFKYLTKGHTHMTADAIHGNIEQAIKKKGDVYDFQDLTDVINTCRRNLTVTKVTQFHNWPKKKRTPRRHNDNNLRNLKLNDIVEAKFIRGSRNMLYKECFKEETYKEVNFLQFKFDEKTQPAPMEETPRGITKKKKEEILKLVRLMPESRKDFWVNLTVRNVVDLVMEGQMESDDD